MCIREKEASAFAGNPVDGLAPLAKAGVPLIHVVGDADPVSYTHLTLPTAPFVCLSLVAAALDTTLRMPAMDRLSVPNATRLTSLVRTHSLLPTQTT